MDNYVINQVFIGIYPPDVADWCNANNCYIEEIEPLEDGTRRFEIKEVQPYIETEEEKAERIAKLNLTGADVERGIYQAIGMDFDDIIALVEHLSKGKLDLETGEIINKSVDIDIKALKIELKANHFYRGNPYVNAVGALLGFTSEQLDKFFETNDYTVLLPDPIEETEEPVVEPVEGEDVTQSDPIEVE